MPLIAPPLRTPSELLAQLRATAARSPPDAAAPATSSADTAPAAAPAAAAAPSTAAPAAATAAAGTPGPSGALRVVSWNIGLRGLEKLCVAAGNDRADVHGISRRAGFGSLSALLAELDADIVCLQEVKLRQLGAPERHLALIDGWDSYFGLCRTQTPSTSHGRYAGVATFCRSACRARLAEEGVTGILAPSAGGGSVGHADELAARFSRDALREIDGEGRCMLTVHGDLAIFNVYAPALTSDDAAHAERRCARAARARVCVAAGAAAGRRATACASACTRMRQHACCTHAGCGHMPTAACARVAVAAAPS
eukprot:2510163-Prymnesium_polylepis.1